MDAPPVSTGLLLRASLVTALVDVLLLALLSRIGRETFRRMKWPLAAVSAIVWGGIWWGLVSRIFWEEVYRHVFPEDVRWWLPAIYGPAYGLAALLFWSLAVRARRWPAAWFCLLGGLVSIPGHAWGFRRGLMRVPLLAGASPWAALLFGVFEFVVYFSAIVGLARLAVALQGGDRLESAA